MKDMRHDALDLLHPRCILAFERCRDDLAAAFTLGKTPVLFRPFETFRSPARQLEVFRAGNSRARPWLSPHNYGLACDFAPVDAEGRWTWDIRPEHWGIVRECAIRFGMDAPISWDRGHVQHPLWNDLRQTLRI